MTPLDQIKNEDLRVIARERFGLKVDPTGKCSCPFHPPDENGSFSIFKGQDGTWRWKDHHDGSAGTVVDLMARINGISEREAIDRLLSGTRPTSTPRPRPEVIRKHIYLDADGKPVFRKTKLRVGSMTDWRFDHNDSGAWKPGKNGRDFIPYRLEMFKDHNSVIVAEGEKDADTINALGLPEVFATSAPTGCSSWPDSITPYFAAFKTIAFLYDVGNDGHVEKHAAKLNAAFPACEIRIAKIPGEHPREYDITDYLGSEPGKADALLEILATARPFPDKSKPKEPPRDSLAEIAAHTVKIKPISYLWRNVIPLGMSTSITGDPGEGKTLVTIDMTARNSRGIPFPKYGELGPPVCGHTFYISSEGVPEMILVPRLIAAGADLSKVTIIDGIRLKNGEFSVLDVTRHLPMIAARARDFPDLKLIVIDPIASFTPERINPSQQNQVRQMMDRISILAHQLNVAAVVVMHFNKTSGGKAGQKTSGSMQFGAAVKMSWSVVRREGDPRNVRLLVPQKSNITGGYESLSFHIQEEQFPAPDDPETIIKTVKINYQDLINEDPEALICPPVEPDNNVAAAVRFLRHKLGQRVILFAKELIDEAEENGIPKWALYKAKNRLGVSDDKESKFQGRTFWFIKTNEAVK